jgi:DNA-binding NtrC family response regulator
MAMDKLKLQKRVIMKILLVDDDLQSLNAVQKYLVKPLGYDVTSFTSCDDAYQDFLINNYQIIISDIRMRGMTGLDFLREVKKHDKGSATDFILMTGYGELSTCIEALRQGASDYLLKPISIKYLSTVIDKIKKMRELMDENKRLKHEVSEIIMDENEIKLDDLSLIGENKDIGIFTKQTETLKEMALKFHAKRKVSVLIEGETGTGKEVFARLIHDGLTKSDEPFISVNCSAINSSLLESELFGYSEGAFTGAKKKGAKGKFEAAQNGTIFLDEIGDMPIEMQPALLRVLQEREVVRVGSNNPIPLDVRFVFATNKNLKNEVEKGNFREDLYYRISTGYLSIPPLRDRKSEIIPLSMMFLRKFSKENNCSFKSISREALYMLKQYYFPGNIRELKNIIERAAVMNEHETTLRLEHLKFLKFSYDIKESNLLTIDLEDEKHSMKDIQREVIRKVYKMFNGNINQGAKFLSISWATFEKFLK